MTLSAIRSLGQAGGRNTIEASAMGADDMEQFLHSLEVQLYHLAIEPHHHVRTRACLSMVPFPRIVFGFPHAPILPDTPETRNWALHSICCSFRSSHGHFSQDRRELFIGSLRDDRAELV